MAFDTSSQAGAAATGFTGGSFSLSSQEFESIRTLVKEHTGISLGLHKKDLVVSRLSRRLRALNFSSFKQYVGYLRSPEGIADELVQMVNRITTNKTDFYREKHHFDLLSNKLLPQIAAEGESSGRRRLRAWSAGCSSGEEPYTLAITFAEFFANKPGWDVKLLASDLDTTMLSKASEGLYEGRLLEPVDRRYLLKYFTKVNQGGETFYQAKPVLRNFLTFRKFNLMHPTYPMKVPLDFVFCRNVLIYFDNKEKVEILTKFHEVIKPGGHIFVGHSESLMMVSHLFKYVATTVYQKV